MTFFTKQTIASIVTLGIVLGGLFAVGSYDPRHELAVLAPNAAVAALSVPTLDTSELAETSGLNTQLTTTGLDDSTTSVLRRSSSNLSTPTVETPELETTSVEAPTLTQTDSSASFCRVRANVNQVVSGGTVTISWETSGYSTITINGQAVNGASGSKTYTITQNTTYTLVATDGSSTCTARVTVQCLPEPLPACTLQPASKTITRGDSVTLVWTTDNVTEVTLSGFGNVALDGSRSTGPLTSDTTYTLTAKTASGKEVQCISTITVIDEPAASCDAFTATPATIDPGDAVTLAWGTTNATRVVINQGVGEVAADGSTTVRPLDDTTYTLTAFGVNGQEDQCAVTVNVDTPNDTVPSCDAFTVDRTSLPAGGGTVTLTWATTRATSVSIAPGVGNVPVDGSRAVDVTTDTTFVLTARDADGDEDTCQVAVDVATPTTLSCANNVNFRASDYSIRRGDSTTLTWETTGVSQVSITPSLGSVSLDGSATVDPASDTTYTLVASNGTDSVSCPLSIDVSSGGGGGGGSSNPRCELDISDDRIERGEEVTLTWDTSRATEVSLEDDEGNVVFTTEDLLADDKEEFFDGEIDVAPREDTTYTLVAKRGSRDVDCEVDVEVDEEEIAVFQVRDQQPLVASIALTQVPYTGFEAGPILTTLFYLLLIAWALYVTYVLVIKRDSIAGFSLAPAGLTPQQPTPKERAPEFFPRSAVTAATAAPAAPAATENRPQAAVGIPTNLPTGTPTIGYANVATSPTAAVAPAAEAPRHGAPALEQLAHQHRVLLSGEALRSFTAAHANEATQVEALTALIAAAKQQFPAEDGWVVINEQRMRALLGATAPTAAPATVPFGTSSLAEAIVTGNVTAAYQMIGHRPMFALADAAADLDAVYRLRQGGKATISDLLKAATDRLSDEQLQNAITALTGALDGTYTDEASAVKMAIMKAVKAVA